MCIICVRSGRQVDTSRCPLGRSTKMDERRRKWTNAEGGGHASRENAARNQQISEVLRCEGAPPLIAQLSQADMIYGAQEV